MDDSTNIYITGNTNSGITTLKYNTNGPLQWVVSHNGYQSIDIAVDRSSNVYVTGGEVYTNNMYDYITIKYSQISGIYPLSNEIPARFKLYQNRPNPFNGGTKFKIDVSSNVMSQISNVKLILYDILGKEVETLVNGQLNPGTYEVIFDGTGYPSGVYYYTLIIGDHKETKKMVLIK